MGSVCVEAADAPPNCGRRLIPSTIDHIAEVNPSKVFGSLPVSNTDLEAGFKDLTYGQVANAINGVAWWLERELGRSHSYETLAYLAPNDFRYPIFAVAAVKAGYTTLFNSPRNSLQGHVNLFKSTECTTLVTSEPVPPYVAPLLAGYAMRVLRIPGNEELLDGPVFPNYPFEKTLEDAHTEPFVILHTSGSTGLPKPVTLTHGYFAALDAMAWLPAPAGTSSATRKYYNTRMFNAMPAFHAGGCCLILCFTVFAGTINVLPPSNKPLDASTAILAHKFARAELTFLLPALYEEMSKTPGLLDQLSDMRYAIYSGGPLSEASGDAVRTKTRVQNYIGATEIGCLPQLEVDQEDWRYIAINPNYGAEFRHHSEDLYELFIVRDKELEAHQPAFQIFPNLQEFSMTDLYVKHPTKPGLWLHSGRADDIIVYVTGEKFNPVSMENLIQSGPMVRSALVTGTGRFQSALLIEPTNGLHTSAEERARMIEAIWPVVEQANSECPTHAKVSKSLILFTTPEKPMLRAGKGTVQRKLTIGAYLKELDAIYAEADTIDEFDATKKIDVSDLDATRASIQRIIEHATSIHGLGINDDFISYGMDSLQVLTLIKHLKAGLITAGVDSDNLAPSTIYTNPTVSKLSDAVLGLKGRAQGKKLTDEKARIERMQAMLTKYSAVPAVTVPVVAVLTGSTGTLGSYLLEALAASPDVSRIYCLNRSANAEERQVHVSSYRGLSTQWDKQRIKFLTCDLSKEYLGLDVEAYLDLISHAMLVLHNAWQVDFNLSLSSFEPVHIQGVRHLIDFSALSVHKAKIFFVSSIGAVMNWSANHTGRVLEEIVDDFTVPQAIGYAESKYVAERLLDQASRTFGTPVSICRVGQIAGPVGTEMGMWNRKEWFPSIIASSKYLGMIPESLGAMNTVDWIPIDILSKIIVELALLRDSSPGSSRVYHTVNPRTSTWDSLLPTVDHHLGNNPKIVPFAAWLKALKQSSSTTKDVSLNPAIKLLEFFENLQRNEHRPPPTLETAVTVKSSKTLAQLGPVQAEWMERWMKQWNF
ncbi:MAG: hypothetical protein FRX48_01253 [Lasallia pustulata]|uniref:Carrier domain-containing protein n=1 Tax=Lasallia pustulata TaxID=136370 RepID=A0A5M8Q0K6_9LECA|nr:MAG: hypothetical protein FRX48_01253 [Lasallia pustulata]